MRASTSCTFAFLLLSLALLSAGCRYGETGMGKGPFSITINWDANHETAVNTSGGGYRVYYSLYSDFRSTETKLIDVPYVSGALAPTSATISNLTMRKPYRYYIRVVAYSALTTASGAQAVSPATETSVMAE